MRLLPFDLEKALAGADVVTRDGREVTSLKFFPACRGMYPLAGLVSSGNPELHSWTAAGHPWPGDDAQPLDLFMPARPIVRWVNFYGRRRAYAFDSQAEADEDDARGVFPNFEPARLYGRAIRVEIDLEVGA